MSDLIDRQAAIDAIVNTVSEIGLHDNSEVARYGATFRQHEIIDIIEGMPSTQPEPCEDAVSRRRLLSDLKELTAAWGKYPVMTEQIKGVETAIGYVETIPSVKPEQRGKGKWIEEDDGWDGVFWRCSECNEPFYLVDGTPVDNEYHYCPNCGADMRGEQDDKN